MHYEKFKEEFAIGTLIKYVEINRPTSLQEQIWNSTVRQGLIFKIVGHLGMTVGSEDVFKVLATVFDYDEKECTMSEEFLEDEHILYIGETRLPYLKIISSEIKQAKHISNFPHVCPYCGAPAYVGIFSVDCSNNCH
jgi:hypothetical protein